MRKILLHLGEIFLDLSAVLRMFFIFYHSLIMKNKSLFLGMFVFGLGLAGCGLHNHDYQDQQDGETLSGLVVVTSGYTAESWKNLIPNSCQSFFDGCNQCNRIPESDGVACTRMFCDVYEEPRCLDEEPYQENVGELPLQETFETEVNGGEADDSM